MKPILMNTDPIIVSYLRVLIAAIGMLLSFILLPKTELWSKVKNLKQTSIAISSGIMGMGLGMTLFIVALKEESWRGFSVIKHNAYHDYSCFMDCH